MVIDCCEGVSIFNSNFGHAGNIVTTITNNDRLKGMRCFLEHGMQEVSPFDREEKRDLETKGKRTSRSIRGRGTDRQSSFDFRLQSLRATRDQTDGQTIDQPDQNKI
jgi:hypothetical protein